MNKMRAKYVSVPTKETMETFEDIVQEKGLSAKEITAIFQAVPSKLEVSVHELGLYEPYMLKGKYGSPDITDGIAIVIRQSFPAAKEET